MIVTAAFYPLQQMRGVPYKAEDLPSVPKLALEVTLTALLQGGMFYYSHR